MPSWSSTIWSPGSVFSQTENIVECQGEGGSFLQPIVAIKDNDGWGEFVNPINMYTVASNPLPPVIFPPSIR